MPIKIPELVLLDLDGTLVDSIPDLANSVNKTLLELSITERDITSIRNWVGNGIEKLLHRSLTNDFDGEAEADLLDSALTKFMSIYNDNICAASVCYPGVHEGINFLKEKDIKLGCVTNKNEQFIEPILEKLGLMNDMSNLFRLQETVGVKASQQRNLSAIRKWMKNNPLWTKTIGGAAILGVGGRFLPSVGGGE